jgi:hypothetical protein
MLGSRHKSAVPLKLQHPCNTIFYGPKPANLSRLPPIKVQVREEVEVDDDENLTHQAEAPDQDVRTVGPRSGPRVSVAVSTTRGSSSFGIWFLCTDWLRVERTAMQSASTTEPAFMPLLCRRAKLAGYPSVRFGLHRIGLNLRLMDVSALGASQRPVLEPGTAGRRSLDERGRLALRTTGSRYHARR